MTATARRPLFPVVRHLSDRVTPLLARLPVTANQITTVSLLAGLATAWCLFEGGYDLGVIGAGLLIVCYVLDNCDGEIARLKGQTSTFGMHYDTCVDWIVHTAFFAALGLGWARTAGDEIWMWMGWIAAAGGTINYVLGQILERHDNLAAEAEDAGSIEESDQPQTPFEWIIYIFRELTRADFCFLVLALAAFDVLWVLLPAGAIGAQVYWILLCLRRARKFHA